MEGSDKPKRVQDRGRLWFDNDEEAWQSRLCDECKRLDFERILRCTVEGQEIGHLTDITARTNICEFCNLVSFVVTEKLKRKVFASLPPDVQIACRCDVVSTPDNAVDSLLHSSLRVRFFNKLDRDVEYSGWKGRFPEISLQVARFPWVEADASVAYTRRFKKSGRRLKGTVDAGLLCCWVNLCERYHEKYRLPSWQVADEWPSGMRLFDVVKRMVIDAYRKCRFAALSYVWGKSSAREHFTPTKLKIIDLSRKEASVPLDRLPRTVRDAIDLVRQMGERYIWVDFLCIVQDDPVDFHHQINQMDTIYSQATFTICATTITDAADGLPCLSKPRGTLQHFARVGKGFGLVNILDGARYFNDVWKKRGWTCQENLLSKRQLIFTDDQVFWRCLEDYWKEESIWEPTEDGQRDDEHCRSIWTGLEFFERDQSRFALANYPSIVQDYSMREFTDEADIIGASRGFVHRIALVTGERFHWGLPQTNFKAALLWTPRNNGKRRCCKVQVPLSDNTLREIPIPSWTWLGWNCLVRWEDERTFYPKRYRKHNAEGWIERNSDLTWYKLGLNGEKRVLERPRHEGFDGNRILPRWKPVPEHAVGPPSERGSRFVDTGLLLVETSCSRLCIRRSAWPAGRYDGSHERFYMHEFQVLDDAGEIIGHSGAGWEVLISISG